MKYKNPCEVLWVPRFKVLHALLVLLGCDATPDWVAMPVLQFYVVAANVLTQECLLRQLVPW